MKTTIFTVLFSLVFLTLYSQETKKEDVYIYVENDKFIGAVLGYKAYFSISSKDKRFKSDNYYFKISFNGLDYQSLYNLGTLVNKDEIDAIEPHKYFGDFSNCELHDELSLLKNIHIVTDLPNIEGNGMKKYLMWNVHYAGTLKNVVHTNMGKPLLKD